LSFRQTRFCSLYTSMVKRSRQLSERPIELFTGIQLGLGHGTRTSCSRTRFTPLVTSLVFSRICFLDNVDGSASAAPRFLDSGAEGACLGVDPFEAGVPFVPFWFFSSFLISLAVSRQTQNSPGVSRSFLYESFLKNSNPTQKRQTRHTVV